ncbi:MAG TPA: serine hydrolase domain-containing protein [Vicinamibacterales bacterium]
MHGLRLALFSGFVFLSPALLHAQLDSEPEWEGFIDGVMAAQQEAHHYAGAVVVVVSGGRIAFSKGYGYADFAERRPVDPARTLFRVASNSKMFVWTAVMQLVEQGRLDLRTDVNRYLQDVQVPPSFDSPITLEHLMTHTPGFEDRIVGLFAKNEDRVRPLVELLRDGMPARIYAPGTVTAYSNYGTALAALIVEQVSGLPYERYLEDRILGPLGMTRATIRQPVPPGLAADLSKGYRWADGRLTEQPFEYVPWAPAGAMSVSGDDMGRFMLAHLHDGALGDARILRAETARTMRQRLGSSSPAINGMLHGFIESGRNGEAAYGHGGATIWFHSLTTMLPARRLGVFVAYNTDSAQAAVPQFAEAFFDHYFPAPIAKEPAVPREGQPGLDRFAGTYAQARVSESDLSKLLKLLGARITVEDGYLVMRGGGAATRWRQIEPLVFVQVNGTRRLAFQENDRGEVVAACASPECVVVMQKQPPWRDALPQAAWLGTCLAILAAAVVGFPIAAVLQRRVRKPRGAKAARLLAWATSLAFVAGVAAAVAGLSDVNGTILFGEPAPALGIGLGLFVFGSVLSVGLAGMTVLAWRWRWWHVAGRVCVTLVCAAALGAAAWLSHWNLLGWNY